MARIRLHIAFHRHQPRPVDDSDNGRLSEIPISTAASRDKTDTLAIKRALRCKHALGTTRARQTAMTRSAALYARTISLGGCGSGELAEPSGHCSDRAQTMLLLPKLGP